MDRTLLIKCVPRLIIAYGNPDGQTTGCEAPYMKIHLLREESQRCLVLQNMNRLMSNYPSVSNPCQMPLNMIVCVGAISHVVNKDSILKFLLQSIYSINCELMY